MTRARKHYNWLVLATVAAVVAGCNETGDEFVGDWVAANGAATMRITKPGTAFILTFRGGSTLRGLGRDATGIYKDGALHTTRAGRQFRLVYDKKRKHIITGFNPPSFSKRPKELRELANSIEHHMRLPKIAQKYQYRATGFFADPCILSTTIFKRPGISYDLYLKELDLQEITLTKGELKLSSLELKVKMTLLQSRKASSNQPFIIQQIWNEYNTDNKLLESIRTLARLCGAN